MTTRAILDPNSAVAAGTPGYEVLKRIADIMAEIYGTVGVENPIGLGFSNEEHTEIMVQTQWGSFYVIDMEHHDHWTGALPVGEQRVTMPGCHELHQVLFMSISTLLDNALRRVLAYRDGQPPPSEMH